MTPAQPRSRTERIGMRTDHLGEARVGTARRLVREVADRAPFAVDVYQFARAPAVQTALWRDQQRWARGAATLRQLPPPPPDAPVVLAVSTSDRPFDVKLRVLLTAGLRARGWRVVVLARNRRSPRLHRLYRAAGIGEFVYLDEVELDPDEQAAATAHVAALRAARPWTFGQVRAWSFGRSWIGPQVLATVSRRLLEGAPDPSRPEVDADIDLVLPQAVETALRAEHVVRALAPRLAVLDEYNYTVAGPITDCLVAGGAEVVTARPMFDPDALLPTRLTASSRRVHHAAVSAGTVDRLSRHRWTEAHQQVLDDDFERRYGAGSSAADATTRDDVVAVIGLRGDRPIAVVFSHILWDANLFYGEDLFDGFGHWLAATVRAAARNDAVDWVVKLHPANLDKARFHGSSRLNELEILEREVGELPGHVHLLMPDAPIPALALYRHADVGLTVRGTPGIEMPCFGRPVLTAGTGRYEGLGFTIDSTSADEYLDRLGLLHHVEPLTAAQVQRARWHAYALFRLREWRPSSARIERTTHQRGWHPLEVNLRAVNLDPAAPDIDELTRWMTEDGSVDFVTLDPLTAP